MVMVALALFIHVVDHVFCVLFGEAELPHDLEHLRVIITEHEDFDRVVVIFQHFFGASPDDDEISDVAYEYIQGWIRDLETLLKDNAKIQAHAYEEFLDVDTAIDYLIVEELTGNNDFYNYWPEVGPHSAYLYKERSGKLYHGPVWDFDFHVFCPEYTRQWVGATKTIFYPALLKDEKFRARLVERWDLQKDELKKLPDYIDEQADYIRESEWINQSLWPIDNNENGDEKMTFQQSVDRIKKAFLDKWEWMDQNIRSLKM